MKKLTHILFVFALSCTCASAQTAFDKVRCESDIASAIIGQRSPSQTVAFIENRHKKIGLKHLGADEISNRLSSISWLICGKEFMTLEDRSTVRDAIPFPDHSKAAPAFSGLCKVNGRDSSDVFVGILDISADGDMLPVKSAWRIDQKTSKFVKVSTEGLQCPRSGIYTVDGGM